MCCIVRLHNVHLFYRLPLHFARREDHVQRNELLTTIEHLCDVELDTLERDDLADVVATTARVRGWLDATELRCTRRARSLAKAGRAEPAPSLIAHNSKRSSRDANQIDRRNDVAEAMPSFENNLEDSTVSAGHLDAIANATRHAPPEVCAAFAAHEVELVALAANDSVEVFARRCRALVAELTTELTGDDSTELDRQRAASKIRQWVDADDGLHHTHIALDPLRHEILWNAINRNLRRRQQHDGNARTPWNQMQVDALIDAVQGGSVDNHRPRRPATTPSGTATSDATPTGATTNAAAPNATRPTGATTNTTRPATDTAEPASATRPPSPAADIARDLADAIDRSIARHRPPAEPDEYSGGGNVSGNDSDDAGDDDYIGDAGDDSDAEDDSVVEAELRHIEQRIPEVSVLTDLSFLMGELHAAGICETEDGNPLPVSTVRRLCCDAEIIPITLGADGVPIDVGRTARTVNRAQRRALRAMHRTCAHPDCTVPFSHTKIHHVRWWTRDRGPTDIDNLLPLCERHHHLVHEGRWTLTMTPDRVATWTRPDGTIHHQGSTIDRRPAPAAGPTSRGAPPINATRQ